MYLSPSSLIHLSQVTSMKGGVQCWQILVQKYFVTSVTSVIQADPQETDLIT